MGDGASPFVRPVTDEEVEYFRVNGWVFLPGLIPYATATEMLERAQALVGKDGAPAFRESIDRPVEFYRDHKNIGRDEDKLFWSVATDRTLGANAARLLGRMSPVRLMTESLAVKLPEAKKKLYGQGAEATDWHQDWHSRAIDRPNLNVWLALDDIPPEKGSMRFYEGSQALGPLGMAEHQQRIVSTKDSDAKGHDQQASPQTLPEKWPRLRECRLSDPLHYRPGDATMHSSLIVHGAPVNETDQPRWAYLISLNPGDAIYNGAPQYMYNAIGLHAGDPVAHPNFPVIFDPEQLAEKEGEWQ